MLIHITLFALISIATPRDVFRFEIPLDEKFNGLKYCDKEQKYRCSSDETCCRTGLPDPNQFRCCGLEKANCCNNGKVCCPESYICSSSNDRCYLNFQKHFLSLTVSPVTTQEISYHQIEDLESSSVVCPDSTKCDDGTTCCQLEDGSFQCCPLANAVCCSDQLHCCPQNTTCNVAAGRCDRVDLQISLSSKINSPKILADITCPDNSSQCEANQTCCITEDDSYACCPGLDAVCCSDKLHCCPNGTVCDITAAECKNVKGQVVPSKKKMPSKELTIMTNHGGDINCNGSETCCVTPDGRNGCCPFPTAVCCSDKIHCCPHDTSCNLNTGTCDHRKQMSHLLLKTVLLRNGDLIVCPDGSQCNDDQTCCLSGNGGYGCCNGINYVCCPDHIHCCPKDTSCNLNTGTCDNRKQMSHLLLKTVLLRNGDSIVCPDGSQCNDDQTCCLNVNDGYGCCPGINKVCCPDHIHCCPKDTICHDHSRTCIAKNGIVTPMLRKVPSKNIDPK